MIRIVRLIGALALGWAVVSGPGPAVADGRVPLPELAAPAKGESCVEPTEVMRRDHMEFLKTQRDETVHLGIRDGKYSLTGCIECHAAADPDAADPSVKSIEGFCEECHSYAAVNLDCWSCHNPKLVEPEPSKTAEAPATFGDTPDGILALLKAHLSDGSATP